MRTRVNDSLGAVRRWLAALALSFVPAAASAEDPLRAARVEPGAAEDEGRWVASLAVSSGVLLQRQEGFVESCLFANPADATGCPAPGSVPLRVGASGSSLTLAAFVGASLEAMAPALPLPSRPRLFASGEIVPTFSSGRDLASQGNPDCVRGPDPVFDDFCAREQDEIHPEGRPRAYGEDAALGQGSVVEASHGTLGFGANLGVAFPVRSGERRLRIKPSVGWLSYEVEASGLVVDAECEPELRCTKTGALTGSLSETTLRGSKTQRYHAIGPGLELEVGTGRLGPLGTSIFLAGRAYRTLGDRRIEFGSSQLHDSGPLAGQAVAARWEVEIDPWIYRAGVGLRVEWLGSAK